MVTQIDIPNPQITGRTPRTFRFKKLTKRQQEFLRAGGLGLGGFSLGVVVTALLTNNLPADTEVVKGEVISNTTNRQSGEYDVEVPVYTEAPFSDAVADDMSFNEAFAAARRDVGPGGFFEWRGETYNTYYGEEWDALSPEEQNEFIASIDHNHIPEEESGISDEEIIAILNDKEITDTDVDDLIANTDADDADAIVLDGDEEQSIVSEEEEIIVDTIDDPNADGPVPNEVPEEIVIMPEPDEVIIDTKDDPDYISNNDIIDQLNDDEEIVDLEDGDDIILGDLA